MLSAGQKYCIMWEHSAILSTFMKLPFVIKIFVLSIFEWPFYTGFTVLNWFLCKISLYDIFFLKHQILLYTLAYDMGLNARKPDFVACEQQKCRPACAFVILSLDRIQ